MKTRNIIFGILFLIGCASCDTQVVEVGTNENPFIIEKIKIIGNGNALYFGSFKKDAKVSQDGFPCARRKIIAPQDFWHIGDTANLVKK